LRQEVGPGLIAAEAGKEGRGTRKNGRTNVVGNQKRQVAISQLLASLKDPKQAEGKPKILSKNRGE